IGDVEQRRVTILRLVIVLGEDDPAEHRAIEMTQPLATRRGVDRVQIAPGPQGLGFDHVVLPSTSGEPRMRAAYCLAVVPLACQGESLFDVKLPCSPTAFEPRSGAPPLSCGGQ